METNKELLPELTLSHGFNERYPNTVWAKKDGDPWEQFCFTDNCEDWAMLIQNFSIALSFDTCQVHAKSYFSDTERVSYSRKDIGLSVCIAFLEMRDWQEKNEL
ncbi:hypothetical protein [Vibrio parahaemolyticus]|uniref:hypothetical protein n=1 Tax=Vibrio parahaemolyticus TaxID=670 RepID=UPI0038928EC4